MSDGKHHAHMLRERAEYMREAGHIDDAELDIECAAEIERLTAERDAALAKVAQYEQAPVVGWKLMHPLLHTRFSLHPITDGDRSLGWTDTALIARPEVTK
jgi:hypothetical protein